MRAAALLLLLVAVAAPRATAGPLSPAERRAVAAIRAGTPEATALLERLVNQNSGTGNGAGVRAVGELLRPGFEALGFRVRWADGAAWNRAGHLLAGRRGAKPRLRVLLIGHLDTVFEADSPFQRFERTTGSLARGPGIADMKGGDVAMLLALRGLAASGDLERLDVRVVLSGDEERMGEPRALARADLEAAARASDVALDFEDGTGDPGQAVTARRGSQGWTLATSGVPAHSSQVFRAEVGAGAIYEMARVLDEVRDSLAAEPHLTVNAGLAVGGSHLDLSGAGRASAGGKSNIVPESTVVRGDLRALTEAQFAHARAVMDRIAARHLPRTGAAFTFDEGYPPFAPGAAHDALLAAWDAASRDLGYGPVRASNPDDVGASDISWVGGLVPRALDGLGLGGSGGHTVNETGDLAALPRSAERTAVLLARLARAAPAAARVAAEARP